jgi:hypothetical protein
MAALILQLSSRPRNPSLFTPFWLGIGGRLRQRSVLPPNLAVTQTTRHGLQSAITLVSFPAKNRIADGGFKQAAGSLAYTILNEVIIRKFLLYLFEM